MTLAIRNTDGAKIYNITAQNITAEIKNGVVPWAAVRLGENNWYKKRPAESGEVYGINISGVKCEAKGAVYLSGALADSCISDVKAGGTSLYAVSTYMTAQRHTETGCELLPGISMKNVILQNIEYSGSSEYEDSNEKYTELTFPNENFVGCAVDFRCLRDTDILENVTIKNVTASGGREKLLLKPDFKGIKNCIFPE